MKGEKIKKLPPPRGGGLQLWKRPIAGRYLLIGTVIDLLKAPQNCRPDASLGSDPHGIDALRMQCNSNRYEERAKEISHTQTCSGGHSRRWRRNAIIPVDEGSLQAGGTAWRQVSAGRYPDFKLPELRVQPDSPAHTVQFSIAAPSHFAGV